MQEAACDYAKCVANSKKVSWDIDEHVIRGRTLEATAKFLPDALSMVGKMAYLSRRELVFMSQVQGRTYANMFAVVERFIGAKMLDLASAHSLGDQAALEALVRFVDEELKHQRLFERIDRLAGAVMPPGYRFIPSPNEVATFVLGKSAWAVLALALHIELFTQDHYRMSIEPDEGLSPLFKDVFLYHWREESQHAVVDSLEWQRVDRLMSPEQRDRAVDELISLVRGLDSLLKLQAEADTEYFISGCRPAISSGQIVLLHSQVLRAYRRQYIVAGVKNHHFATLLTNLTDAAQLGRISKALRPIMEG